jgi:predicted transcriptional regulator
MASSIGGATKLRAQLQMAPTAYVDENKSTKLRQNNGLDLTRGSKRERLEIIAEILCYCNQQKVKTTIMHKVNLNYAQLKRYLQSLTANGLLTIDKNRYATTQKGHRFLELFVQLNNMFDP